jgi:heme exporter protein D
MSGFLATLGPHWGFIVAAYGVTAATILGLAMWILVDGKSLRRQLTDLEAKGVRRRSQNAGQKTEQKP